MNGIMTIITEIENLLELQTPVYIGKRLMNGLNSNTFSPHTITPRNGERSKIFNYRYEVGNKLFNIDETLAEVNTYALCEIYARRHLKCSNAEECCASSVQYVNSSHVNIKAIKNGYLINSTVFISNSAWHTFVKMYGESNTCFCVVCDFEDIKNDKEHILSDEHKENMDFFKPITEYDYTIRRIRDQYYCAVCNACIVESSIDLHLNAQYHNSYLATAMQTAFKIVDDDIENMTDSETSDEVNRSSQWNNNIYKDIDKTNDGHLNKYTNNNLSLNDAHGIDDIKGDLFNRLDENIVNNNTLEDYFNYYTVNDNVFDSNSAVENKPDKDLDEYINWYNDIKKEHGDTETEASDGVSYATAVKKSKDPPVSFIIDLDNIKITITSNSWNMIVDINSKNVYCMACQLKFSNDILSIHICERTHLANLAKLTILTEFKGLFVRKVNEKLCHCSHCNNLQFISDMNTHIEFKHSKTRTKETNKSSETNNCREDIVSNKMPLQYEEKSDNNRYTKKDNDNTEGKQIVQANKSATEKLDTKDIETVSDATEQNINGVEYQTIYNARVFYLNGDLMIDFVGSIIRIDHSSYNFVSDIENGYLCKLCYVYFRNSYLLYHIHDEKHMLLLSAVRYNPIYACHLIRHLNNVLHCTICNMEFDITQVNMHILSYVHMMQLNKRIVRNAIDVQSTDGKCNSKEDINCNLIDSNENFTNNHNLDPISNDIINHDDLLETKNDTNDANCIQEIEDVLKVAPDLSVIPISDQNINRDVSTDYNAQMKEFNINEKVYVKLKDMYKKVRHVNYHTLVSLGDGRRKCFVCSVYVNNSDLGYHINQCCHIENMMKTKFVEKYEGDLIRQNHSKYHCTLCNIVTSKKKLQMHTLWLNHEQQKIEAQKSSKRQRRNDIKSGVVQYISSSEKEIIFKDAREEEIVIKCFESHRQDQQQCQRQ